MKRKTLVTLAVFALAFAAGAAALRGPQETPGAEPGRFDFWVLALSWSPTYCRTDGKDDRAQCGDQRRDGFVVHGLWPQFENGYPADCAFGPERIDFKFARDMADLMPSPRLVFYQWRKHGRCAGLSPDGYFAVTRKAAGRVQVPTALMHAPSEKLSPERIEAGFVSANPGLTREAIAVVCHDGLLSEVRVCLDKTMKFRACAEVDADACPARELVLPPVTKDPA